MDANGTVDWLKNVWDKRPEAAFKKPSLLVYDSFRGHFSEEVTKHLKTTVAVIPGGSTSIIPPLDVCFNKPFKVNVRKYWAEWISSGRPTFTKGGNIKKQDITLIAQWVKDAWNEIPSEMIIKSFKKCCISNELDGTEDDAVFESENDDEGSSSDYNNTEYETENMYDDESMTTEEFYEIFGESDHESDVEGFWFCLFTKVFFIVYLLFFSSDDFE
ncbi:Pogo transposable element with KRAB, partial [Stegodyphus mimosarum]